jgi:regulator of replication initiation timing
VVTIDKAVYGVTKSSKALELFPKLKVTSVKLSEILKTRKDNVSRFEEETNAVFAEISNIRKSVNKHLDEIEDKLRNEMTSTKKTIDVKLNDDVTELSSLKALLITGGTCWRLVYQKDRKYNVWLILIIFWRNFHAWMMTFLSCYVK